MRPKRDSLKSMTATLGFVRVTGDHWAAFALPGEDGLVAVVTDTSGRAVPVSIGEPGQLCVLDADGNRLASETFRTVRECLVFGAELVAD